MKYKRHQEDHERGIDTFDSNLSVLPIRRVISYFDPRVFHFKDAERLKLSSSDHHRRGRANAIFIEMESELFSIIIFHPFYGFHFYTRFVIALTYSLLVSVLK